MTETVAIILALAFYVFIFTFEQDGMRDKLATVMIVFGGLFALTGIGLLIRFLLSPIAPSSPGIQAHEVWFFIGGVVVSWLGLKLHSDNRKNRS